MRSIASLTGAARAATRRFPRLLLLLTATALGLAVPAWSGIGDQAPFKRVIIDAGHGGKDEGATASNGILEKELVLDVSSRLRRLLEARNLKVILTRETDRFVPLEVRTSRANDARGDLFISIHANAANSNTARGIETYFVSLEASDAASRRVAERDLTAWIDLVMVEHTGEEALAVRYSHPAWVVGELRRSLLAVDASHELEELLAADNVAPKVTLVARPRLATVAELPGTPGLLSPWAVVLDGGDPGAVAAVREGRAAVQDEGSQLVVKALVDLPLEPPRDRWLDLCAGPGGKAALLGALAVERGARLVANEVQPHRAELVRQAMRALPEVEVTCHDGREGPWEPESFDRILIDAPCTGLGALRRRPEARWRRTPQDLASLAPLQQALLRRGVELVRPGGVVAYATCSPSPAETLEVIESVGRGVAVLERVERWWPHRDGTDAMFVALLRKR